MTFMRGIRKPTEGQATRFSAFVYHVIWLRMPREDGMSNIIIVCGVLAGVLPEHREYQFNALCGKIYHGAIADGIETEELWLEWRGKYPWVAIDKDTEQMLRIGQTESEVRGE